MTLERPSGPHRAKVHQKAVSQGYAGRPETAAGRAATTIVPEQVFAARKTGEQGASFGTLDSRQRRRGIMDKTRANKGGGGKGNQTLKELELELEDELVETMLEKYPSSNPNAILRMNNTRADFSDEDHPLLPTKHDDFLDIDGSVSRLIVRLSLIRALIDSGCERRRDATKLIEDALPVTKGHASKLFNRPWEMQKDHVQALAKVTECTIDRLRGVDTGRSLSRKALKLAIDLGADVSDLEGERLALAVGMIEGLAIAIRALKDSTDSLQEPQD